MRKIILFVVCGWIATSAFPDATGTAAGVLFTFDDTSVDEWAAQSSWFTQYNARITSFVSNSNALEG